MSFRHLSLRVFILSVCALVLLSSPAVGDAMATSEKESVQTTDTPTHPSSSASVPASLTNRPLDELLPQASAYLDTRLGDVGVAVSVPGEGVVYAYHGDALFNMASVAKVPIMLTLLEQSGPSLRGVSRYEESLLESMIIYSDNNAADALWWDVGGAPALSAYLDAIGVEGIQPDPDGYWGESQASPNAMAQLLAELVEGEALDTPGRALAVDLMGEVTPSQRWGVIADVDESTLPSLAVGLKNGWYPAEDGWWVNSVGFVLPDDAAPYTIAIMTDEQPSLAYGIQTIETVARLIHEERAEAEQAG